MDSAQNQATVLASPAPISSCNMQRQYTEEKILSVPSFVERHHPITIQVGVVSSQGRRLHRDTVTPGAQASHMTFRSSHMTFRSSDMTFRCTQRCDRERSFDTVPYKKKTELSIPKSPPEQTFLSSAKLSSESVQRPVTQGNSCPGLV